jgi:hypothetical protein
MILSKGRLWVPAMDMFDHVSISMVSWSVVEVTTRHCTMTGMLLRTIVKVRVIVFIILPKLNWGSKIE